MAEQTRRIIRLLENTSEAAAKRLALDIRNRLVSNPPQGTPRDTSWAASNWLFSVGNPISGTVGSPDSIDSGASGASIGTILRWRFIQGPAYLVNNVPYIAALNAGHSQQAPAMFVELAIQAALLKANAEVLS